MTTRTPSKSKRFVSKNRTTENSSLVTDLVMQLDNPSKQLTPAYDSPPASDRTLASDCPTATENPYGPDSAPVSDSHPVSNNSPTSNNSAAFDSPLASENSCGPDNPLVSDGDPASNNASNSPPASDGEPASINASNSPLASDSPPAVNPSTPGGTLASDSTSSYIAPNHGGSGHSISLIQHESVDNMKTISECTVSAQRDVPKCTRTFEDISGLREDQDDMPIMASILENQVRYHLKTADFEDGVCLIQNIIKGLGAIKKSADLKRNLDFEEVKERIKKGHAAAKTLETRNSWTEAHFYEYIVAAAEIRDIQSRAKTPGRIPHYSAAEIEVADEVVRIVSSAEDQDTFRKYCSFWKFLHDLRVKCETIEWGEESMLKEGLMLILLFQTPKFRRRFFNKTTNALSIVQKWNEVYHPYMRELAARVIAEKKGDFSGRSDFQRVGVGMALSHIPPRYWVRSSPWANDEEKQAYQAAISYDLSSESRVACGTKIDGDDPHNKAIYVFLIPYEGPPNLKKRKFNGGLAVELASRGRREKTL